MTLTFSYNTWASAKASVAGTEGKSEGEGGIRERGRAQVMREHQNKGECLDFVSVPKEISEEFSAAPWSAYVNFYYILHHSPD